MTRMKMLMLLGAFILFATLSLLAAAEKIYTSYIRMAQRWLGAVLLHCEQGLKRVKGYAASSM